MLSQKKLLPFYPPHLKNVTALHLTESNVAFLQILVTLKRAGCGLALVALKMTDQRMAMQIISSKQQ